MKFKVKNFRNFEETDFIEFRPFTLIYGKNGAGKSSLLYLYKIAHAIVNSELTDLFETGINKEEFGLEDIENYISHDPKKPFEITFKFDLFEDDEDIHDFFNTILKEIFGEEDVETKEGLWNKVINEIDSFFYTNYENEYDGFFIIENTLNSVLFRKIKLLRLRLLNQNCLFLECNLKFKINKNSIELSKITYSFEKLKFRFSKFKGKIYLINKINLLLFLFINDLYMIGFKDFLNDFLSNNNINDDDSFSLEDLLNIMISYDKDNISNILNLNKISRGFSSNKILINNNILELKNLDEFQININTDNIKLLEYNTLQNEFYLNTFWIMNNLKKQKIFNIFLRNTIYNNNEGKIDENQFGKNPFNLFSIDSMSFPVPVHIKTNRIEKLISIIDKRNFDDFKLIEKYIEQINFYLKEIFNMRIVPQISNYIINRKKKIDIIIYDKDENPFDPLDLGSGFKNILSILYFIFSNKSDDFYEKILLIEEPELHLHPDLQSKFINIIFDIYHKIKLTNNGKSFYGNKDSFFEFNTLEHFNKDHDYYFNHDFHDYKSSFRFVLETHSENMLWKFYRLIKEKKLSQEEFGLYYVDVGSDGKSVLINLNLDSGGGMAKFPKSFFQSRVEDMLF